MFSLIKQRFSVLSFLKLILRFLPSYCEGGGGLPLIQLHLVVKHSYFICIVAEKTLNETQSSGTCKPECA